MTANLLAWGAQGLALVAAAALSTRVLRGRTPRAELLLWQAVLVAMLLLPVLQPWAHPRLAPEPAAFTEGPVTPLRSGRAAPAPRFLLPDVQTVLIAGAVLRLLWLGLGLVRLSSLRRSAGWLEPDLSAEDATAARAELMISAGVSSPVTFGWLRPVVLVPPTFFDMHAEQRRAVLCHELLHVCRRDWLACLCEEAAASFLWFHPAVWFVIRRIRVVREQVVDAAVVRLTRRRDVYVEALLAAASARPMLDVSAAPLFLRRRDLTNRIKTLLEEHKPMSRFRAFAFWTCITTVVMTAGFLATTTFPLTGAPQTVPGTIVRVETRSLPESVRGAVETRLSGVRGQAFTTELMLQVNNDLARIDANLVRMWVHEAPGVYSLAVSYKSGQGASTPVFAAIDASRLPERAQAAVMERIGPLLRKPYDNALIDTVTQRAQSVDTRISVLWRADPDGNMILILGFEMPPNGYQPVFGVLKDFDLSRVSDTDRSELEHQLAPFRNAPMTTSVMDELRRILGGEGKYTYQYAITGEEEKIIAVRPRIATAPAPAPTSPSGEPVVRLGSEALAARRRSGDQPEYPPLAVRARIQGIVRFSVVIGADGRVREMTLISGHPVLVRAAQVAAQTWKFEPTLLNGLPAVVIGTVDVPFALPRL